MMDLSEMTSRRPDERVPAGASVAGAGTEPVCVLLRGLGREESDSLIAERGQVEVGCEFCGLQYRFDAVDAAGLFTPASDRPPGTTSVN